MAFEHKLYGKNALWGIDVTPLPDDAVFVGSHQLSFNSVNHQQKDKMGRTVGLRISDVEVPFSTSGELVGTAGASPVSALVLGLGLVDSEQGPQWGGYARPDCTELDGAAFSPYVLNYDTSSSRDGVRSVSVSGQYFAF